MLMSDKLNQFGFNVGWSSDLQLQDDRKKCFWNELMVVSGNIITMHGGMRSM